MPAGITIFGRTISLSETRDFETLVCELAYGSGSSVFFCNVHMLMLAQEDRVLANAMDNAGRVFADGVPVAWLQSRLSGKDAKVIRGYEIMLAAFNWLSESVRKPPEWMERFALAWLY